MSDLPVRSVADPVNVDVSTTVRRVVGNDLTIESMEVPARAKPGNLGHTRTVDRPQPYGLPPLAGRVAPPRLYTHAPS